MQTTTDRTTTVELSEKQKGKTVGAVTNAAKILRFLRNTQKPATVTQITRGVEINPSTCFNILHTLIQEDFVQVDPVSKTYQLSLGLVGLARGALEHSPELHILKPHIDSLARKYNMMAAIWRKISDDRSMLVFTAESDASIRIHARAGSRSPLLLGATGRVFVAYSGMDHAALKERFQQLRLTRPLSFETYLEQVEEVRRVGWSIDEGYVTPGTITIAAPVYELSGEVNFSCSAILFNGQYDAKKVEAIAEDLRLAGRALIESATHVPVIRSSKLKPKPKAASKSVSLLS
ncbi:IclR family transcriptional regulator [Alcaligenaceae bacterium]|nr:IclR family transcriptional regulator [Alcaligenaceae bacterium]